MTRFSIADLDAIDRLWRSVPADHVWTGWSACGEEPKEVIIYRTRAHWRKFPLKKVDGGFRLHDERGRRIAETKTLEALLAEVEAIPGLQD
ncbi:MAG: hypothetical protein L3J02_07640 [Henriciella sp.]|nr:hypothetical protein [Henriciella sp.]